MRTGTVAMIAALAIVTALASGSTVFAGDREPLIAPLCPADLNADNIVDQADLDRLLQFYGDCLECEEDLNQDNLVDYADAVIMTQQWGPCPPEGDVFGGDHNKGSLVGELGSLTGSDTNHTTTKFVAPRCEGDLNGDTFVDGRDVAHLMAYYGACAACEEDLNYDGLVDDADAQIIDEQWGPCMPEGDVFGGDHSKGSLTDGTDSLSEMKARVSDGKKGTPEDVNGDGYADMIDVLTVAEYLGQEPTGDKAFSDVNNDGRIDEYDIKAIAEFVISGNAITR